MREKFVFVVSFISISLISSSGMAWDLGNIFTERKIERTVTTFDSSNLTKSCNIDYSAFTALDDNQQQQCFQFYKNVTNNAIRYSPQLLQVEYSSADNPAAASPPMPGVTASPPMPGIFASPPMPGIYTSPPMPGIE